MKVAPQLETRSCFREKSERVPTILVLHGGPDFDHRYLLPDLDRLSDSYRLIYYDQRGRGLSAAGVRPEDVTLASDIADIDKVREHFNFSSVVLLGVGRQSPISSQNQQLAGACVPPTESGKLSHDPAPPGSSFLVECLLPLAT